MKISQHFEIQYVLLIGFSFHFNKLEKFLSLLKNFGQRLWETFMLCNSYPLPVMKAVQTSYQITYD